MPSFTSAQTGVPLTDLMYLAGFVDGEGCFRYRGSPVIEVSNTYPYVLVTLQSLFGGTVRQKRKNNPTSRTLYEWYCSGDTARQAMTILLPLLREKKPQVEILLEMGRYPKRSEYHRKLREKLIGLKRIDYTANRMNRETSCQNANESP